MNELPGGALSLAWDSAGDSSWSELRRPWWGYLTGFGKQGTNHHLGNLPILAFSLNGNECF
jgi:hypothetical protein